MIIYILFYLLNIVQSTTTYQNDYEPRVFNYIPLNCYDCLSYRDIILTQLTDVRERSFSNFHLGSLDTHLILNGQLELVLYPYAFQSLIVQKPNKTLTITLSAPNSWLNITENTFNGLELHPYTTLRIVIKLFYGCIFHKNALSGIKMHQHSHLILDISSITEIVFENNIINENDFNSSVDIFISRSGTILFESDSFYQLNIQENNIISFYLEFISHIHLKSHSFKSLHLHKSSVFKFYSIFLNRLTIDSYAFENLYLNSYSIFNFTINTLGTCLCFTSYSFHNINTAYDSRDVRILFDFHSLRGLSFLSNTFSNLSLNNIENTLEILSYNPLNDPNSIINFDSYTFSTRNYGTILLNFSQATTIRFEKNSLQTNYLYHKLVFSDIVFIDLFELNYELIKTKFHLYFDNINYVQWYKHTNDQKTIAREKSLIEYHFNYMSSSSCLIYSASQFVPWLFPISNLTICNCPLLYAYKQGQLDGQLIPCLQSMSGYETAEQINRCHFDEIKTTCDSFLQSLIDLNNTNESPSKTYSSFELDSLLIKQLYDKNYLTCSMNYSKSSTNFIIRTRLLNNFALVIGTMFGIFFLLLIIVIALLNGLQYKMKEYDESWTWRRNVSWTTLRRTLSQTSLRRSRKDSRTMANGHGITSKSDNQLDRLRYDEDDDRESDYNIRHSQSIQNDLKPNNRT